LRYFSRCHANLNVAEKCEVMAGGSLALAQSLRVKDSARLLIKHLPLTVHGRWFALAIVVLDNVDHAPRLSAAGRAGDA